MEGGAKKDGNQQAKRHHQNTTGGKTQNGSSYPRHWQNGDPANISGNGY
jgi:hypothetical protein